MHLTLLQLPLEEKGMKVKVVRFTDGEDPESCAKKNTEADVREY